MMSGSDGPTAADQAVDTMAANAGVSNKSNEEGDMKQIWRFIYFDMAYVKSLFGIFVLAEIVLSLLGLISVSVPKNEGCAYLYSSTYAYYEFTASSCFIGNLIWYILYLLAITRKLGFIRWDIGELIWLAFYCLNYLIASGVIASNACMQGGYKAAAAFGFFCLFVIMGHGFFAGRAFWEKLRGSKRSAQPAEAVDEENKY